MSSGKDRFFMREDYVPNVVRSAVPTQNYWNERRIETSSLFQYSVYAHARGVLRRRPGMRVLDIGCGTARKAADLLIPYCSQYRGIDQSSAIEYCRRTIVAPNAEFVVDDLEQPTVVDPSSFDLVICADVIEHLANPTPLLCFAHDSLSTNGVFIISTPERDVMHGPNMMRSPNPAHVREWNRNEFRQLLSGHGFRVRTIRLAPQFRLRLSRTSLRLLRGLLHRPQGYWGCQVATCSKG